MDPELDAPEERAHRNLCDFTRFTARLVPASVLVDESGVVAVAAPGAFPTSRTAVRSDDSLTAGDWADKLDAFLTTNGKSGCAFARVGADDDINAELVARGFHEWAQTPEMICEHPLELRELPRGVTVRLAESPADVAAYAAIAGEAFSHLSIPAAVTSQTIDNPEVMLQPDCIIALAESDDLPVAGALVVLLGEEPNGYVGWVACTDAARGQGLGDIVTRAVTNEGFARGARLLTLEASQFGEHTYARMGYREIYRYRVLIRV